LSSASRRYELRQLDYDGDGLVDLVKRTSAGSYRVYLNTVGRLLDGGVLVTGAGLHTDDALFSYAQDDGVWRIKGDVVDVTGDGVADYVKDGVARRVPAATVPVLLSRIDNGHGAVIEVSYAPSTRAEVVQGAMPSVVWVARRTTVKVAGTPDSVTDHAYAQPRNERDLFGRYGFRGFSHVTETGPGAGARKVVRSSYDYALDYRGLLVEQVVSDTTGLVHEVTDFAYQLFPLFDFRLRSYQKTEEKRFVCAGAEAAPACRATGARLRAVTKYAPLAPSPLPATPVPGGVLAVWTRDLGEVAVGSMEMAGGTEVIPGTARGEGIALGPPITPGGTAWMTLYAPVGTRTTDRDGQVAAGDRGAEMTYRLVSAGEKT